MRYTDASPCKTEVSVLVRTVTSSCTQRIVKGILLPLWFNMKVWSMCKDRIDACAVGFCIRRAPSCLRFVNGIGNRDLKKSNYL